MSNLNLIVGEDYTLIDFYLHELCSNIGYDYDDKIEYDLNTCGIDSILDEASTISLFSNRKLIIGNNLNITKISNSEIEYLYRYIKNLNKNVYIIFISKKIDARSKNYLIFKDNFNIIDATKNKDNSNNIKKYITNYIDNAGYKIDSRLIDYLYNKLGNNIDNIKLELDKIFLYKGDDSLIDKDTIDLLVTDNIDNIIYEFTNAYLDKDYDRLIYMYNNFKKENIGFDYLLVSLSNILRQSMIIKLLTNKGKSNLEISKFIGKKEYYVKKMVERLEQYTINDLSDRINELARIDRDFKSGVSHFDELELFLIGRN